MRDHSTSVTTYTIKSAMAVESICLFISPPGVDVATRMVVPKGFLVLSSKELASGASAQLASADRFELVYQLSSDGETSCISLSRRDAGTRVAVCDMYVLDRTVKYAHHCPEIQVSGMRRIANHIIKKKQLVYGVRFASTVIPAYADVDACRGVFGAIRACKAYTPVESPYETHGQACFKTFNHFNCKSVSRILSSFPDQTLGFARGVCLNVAALHVSPHVSQDGGQRLIVAHTLQDVFIEKRAFDTVKKLCTFDAGSTRESGGPNANVLTIATANGVVRTRLVSVDSATQQTLAEGGVRTRASSAMYVCLNVNGSVSLVADVDMAGPGLRTSEQSVSDMLADDSLHGALNRLRFINSACAYHAELRPELVAMSLVWRAVESARSSDDYQNSVKFMLAKDRTPAIHTFACHDLCLE